MPQIIETPGLSKDDADATAEALMIDGIPVEIVPEGNGKFTVRATYPDGAVIPGVPQPPAQQPQQNPPVQAPPRQVPAGGGAMKISPKGVALIKEFEHCKESVPGGFKAYRDPVNVLTIGWGHTNDNGRQFDANSVWTQAECDDEFLKDMAHFENAVIRQVTVSLNQDEFDALVSFTYNLGEGSLERSTLLKKLNAGDFGGAAQEFPRWNKADGQVLPGLVRRRACEALLFQGIPDSNYDGIPD
jgi:lysozyme